MLANKWPGALAAAGIISPTAAASVSTVASGVLGMFGLAMPPPSQAVITQTGGSVLTHT